MKKYLLHILLFISLSGAAQNECPLYQKYIDSGKIYLEKEKFKNAIYSFSTALLHCPDSAKAARALILIAYNKIEDLRKKAVINQDIAVKALEREQKISDSLTTEKIKSDSLKGIADENYQKAIEAKYLSEAYKYIFFAQEAVKVDPILALHITDTALKILALVQPIDKNDSSIYEKALRIYYENNFGETVIDKENIPAVIGNITHAIYAEDGKSIWTLSDASYAYQWSNSGKLTDSIKLDSTLNKYVFKQSGEGKILIHGYDDSQKYPSGKVWKLQKNAAFINIPVNENPKLLIEKKDAIIYNPNRDSTIDWAKRLFTFGDRAFQVSKEGQLTPAIIESSIEIRLIAFSPNGKFVAINDGTRTVKILNLKGELISRISNTGNTPVSLEFSPDNKILVVNNRITLQLYDLSGKLEGLNGTLSEPLSINLQGYPLQTYKFSPDGKMLLLSFSNRNQQISKLYKKNTNNWAFSEFAEFTCIGAHSTSATFSHNPDEIITSSDKVRVWKIPKNPTFPQFLSGPYFDQNTFFSVEHNLDENLIYGYTIAGKKIKFNLDGTKFKPLYADSTYQPDSVTTKITALIPGIKKIVIVSEYGDLNMFHEKGRLEAYLKNFRFEPFTAAQKRKYGIK
jgi:WD40 repeat protein